MLDPGKPAGAIIIAVLVTLIVTVLLASFERVRRRITPSLRRFALRFPPPVRSIFLTGADKVFPWWRSYTRGSQRTRRGTERRLCQMAAARTPPRTVLVGATYLDLSLSPISVQQLTPGEHSGLGRISSAAGGASCFVGKHLFESYKRKSYLFTRIGSADKLSRQLKKHLREQKWRKSRLRMRGIDISKEEQAGISVHLQQDGEHRYHTTFTHTGALKSLGWATHIRRIQRLTAANANAIIFISGFFRTNLQEDLANYLRQISTNPFVVLDHGRFQPVEHPTAIRSLKQAFSEGLIDCYIATFSEIRDLLAAFDLEAPALNDDLLLTLRSASLALPRIVVVRGDSPREEDQAHCIWDEKLISVSIPENAKNDQQALRPGDKSSFIAGFLHGLSK